MRNSSRMFYSPTPTDYKPQSKTEKRPYNPRPLKSLSTRTIWILLEFLEFKLKNSLFYPRAVIEALDKRHRDLSDELDDRLKWDEYMCKVNPIRDENGKPQQLIWVDGHLEPNSLGDFFIQELEGNPPRKALCKSYIRGYRVRPGKKIHVNPRPKWR